MTERTALYRLYGAAGELLYVGITANPEERFASHAMWTWWPEVVTKRLVWYEARSDAAAAEVQAIKRERPRYNRAHADYHPPLGVGAKDLRASLADVLNGAAVRGEITYVTSRGRRIAAIVPVPVAEAEERKRDARQDQRPTG